MEKCTQGELNKKDIENIKTLSQGQSSDIKEIFRIIRNIELQNATMIEKLDESIRNNSSLKIEVKEEIESVKKDLKEHLTQSEGRIKDIERNSTFRKVGCWFFGSISLLAIGSAIDRLIRG